VATIRAFGVQGRFSDKHADTVDKNNAAFMLTQFASNWLLVRLDVLGAVVAFAIAAFAAASGDFVRGSFIGVALSFSIEMTNFLKHMVRMLAQTEMQMNAVERLMHYETEIEPEAEDVLEEDSTPASWPTEGAVDFNDVHMRYRDGPLVLKGLDVHIRPHEKIGIVGRTGAGKSTIANVLFRVCELESGSITIDGVDIKTLGLDRLRGDALAIIPQDPVLFSTNIRENCDPFHKYTDEQVTEVLRLVRMDKYELSTPITEGGTNLSVGERQLVCIARALLRKPKVLMLDEATASIDHESDALIQDMIRIHFVHATVLTIAHRLNTIMDSDRVLVMADGVCAEFDSPAALLSNPDSVLAGMVTATGQQSAAELRAIAEEASAATERRHRLESTGTADDLA
jgi:ABC-type multidrug transport system fused ATPase/permease subunit